MQTREYKEFVLLIDSRGIIKADDVDTFKRHENYGRKLREMLPKSHLYIITASVKAEDKITTNYVTQEFIKCNKRFSLKYLFKSVSLIQSLNSSQIVLVAGDPWEAGLCTRFIQLLVKRKLGFQLPIQMQLHADIADSEWESRSLINRIRAKIAAYNLKKADQIRAVSHTLKNEIVNKFGIGENRLVVSPVALNIPKDSDTVFTTGRPKAIGFAGRFHDERGLSDFLEYVKKVSSVDSSLEIVLAGTGPDASAFLKELYKNIPENRVQFLGHLQKEEMVNFWSKVGVYVSTAKSESYGRSIREAAFFGIPVLGLPSNGFAELIALNVKWIEGLSLTADASDLKSQLVKLLEISTDDSLRTLFTRDIELNSENLIKSWLQIMPVSRTQLR
jgi:glycosyltransferase involved in cell wall biosynthesis